MCQWWTRLVRLVQPYLSPVPRKRLALGIIIWVRTPCLLCMLCTDYCSYCDCLLLMHTAASCVLQLTVLPVSTNGTFGGVMQSTLGVFYEYSFVYCAVCLVGVCLLYVRVHRKSISTAVTASNRRLVYEYSSYAAACVLGLSFAHCSFIVHQRYV